MNETSAEVTSLNNGQLYYFEIVGQTPGFNRGFGLTSEISATPMPEPAKPTGLTATAGDTQITLSWNNPNNASITRWQYQQKPASAAIWGEWTNMEGSEASSTSYPITGLTNGTAYAFRCLPCACGKSGKATVHQLK